MSPPKVRRQRALPEQEQTDVVESGAEESPGTDDGGTKCGWCMTRDCDNCRPRMGRWRCSCDHSLRLPSPRERYGDVLDGGQAALEAMGLTDEPDEMTTEET